MQRVEEWSDRLMLADTYKLRAEQITGAALLQLKEADLKELGVSMGVRRLHGKWLSDSAGSTGKAPMSRLFEGRASVSEEGTQPPRPENVTQPLLATSSQEASGMSGRWNSLWRNCRPRKGKSRCRLRCRKYSKCRDCWSSRLVTICCLEVLVVFPKRLFRLSARILLVRMRQPAGLTCAPKVVCEQWSCCKTGRWQTSSAKRASSPRRASG